MSDAIQAVGKHTVAALASGIGSTIGGIAVGTMTSAAAMLGQAMMKSGGDPVADFSFKDIVLPTIVGSAVLLGGVGFLSGAVTGKIYRTGW